MNLVSREKAIDVAIDEYNRGYKEGFEAASLKWIPCSERLPEVGKDGESEYVLLSFFNATLPCIGQYREDSEGGAFYAGDDEAPLNGFGLFVNAWMPLPEPYKGE